MKVTFLGTSAGRPTRERNVSAAALSFDQESRWYLFDCGEGTQHQIMKSSLSSGKLETIFITHMHGDHYYGLPGLLDSRKMDRITKPLTIYGPKGITSFLNCVIDTSIEKLGYDLHIIEYEIDQEFEFDHFSLKVLPLHHSIESHAFYIKEHTISNRLDEEKLCTAGLEPSLFYGELKRGRSVVYGEKTYDPDTYLLDPIKGRSLIMAGDNSDPDILGDYLNDLDLLVHECTYTQEVYDHLPVKVLHTTARELGICAEKRRVKNLIATHISPRYRANSKYSIDMIEDEIREYYRGTFFIANDLDTYWLKREESLEGTSKVIKIKY
ncbi:MAG: ribonuclease Z [Campylobacterota bacterium]|nr:ribonuclease Z [Campylobacterota bacterium]